jgi:hypothetical protein
MIYLGERISVTARFGFSEKIKPVKFYWSNRFFEVREITCVWKTKEGQTDIYHFSLTDGQALYELTFDTGSLVWKLENLETY